MKTTFYVLVLIIIQLFTGCFSDNNLKPQEILPPATQNGTRSFGFFLNGKVWIPKGYDGTSNYSMDVDPTFSDGIFDMAAYRYPNAGDGTGKGHQFFRLGSGSIKDVGIYLIQPGSRQEFWFNDYDVKCFYASSDTVGYQKGFLKITRYDWDKGIFSGEFELTIWKPGCDTLRITQGRFDYKFS